MIKNELTPFSSYLNQQGYRTEHPTGKEEFSFSIAHHYDPDEDKTRFRLK